MKLLRINENVNSYSDMCPLGVALGLFMKQPSEQCCGSGSRFLEKSGSEIKVFLIIKFQ